MHTDIMHKSRRLLASAVLLLTVFAGWADITVSFSQIPLRKAMREIEKVSDLHFFYKATLEGLDTKVSLSVKDATTKETLDGLFAKAPLSYKLESNGTVVVYHEKEPAASELNGEKAAPGFGISGTVTDENGDPVIGATVKVRGTKNAAATDYDGHYTLSNLHQGDVVEV